MDEARARKLAELISGHCGEPMIPLFVKEAKDDMNDTPESEPISHVSLRDYFAASAIRLAHEVILLREEDIDSAGVAEWSYNLADAMLEARERKE